MRQIQVCTTLMLSLFALLILQIKAYYHSGATQGY